MSVGSNNDIRTKFHIAKQKVQVVTINVTRKFWTNLFLFLVAMPAEHFNSKVIRFDSAEALHESSSAEDV